MKHYTAYVSWEVAKENHRESYHIALPMDASDMHNAQLNAYDTWTDWYYRWFGMYPYVGLMGLHITVFEQKRQDAPILKISRNDD